MFDYSSKDAATIWRRASKTHGTGASEEQRYEEAAGYRDLLRTLAEMEERQKIAAAAGDDTDVIAWYAEPPQVAVNLFHLRGGRVVDRRDFYWEDLDEFDPAEFLPSLLKQLYLDAGLFAALHPHADGFRRSRAARRSSHAKPPGIAWKS